MVNGSEQSSPSCERDETKAPGLGEHIYEIKTVGEIVKEFVFGGGWRIEIFLSSNGIDNGSLHACTKM